MSYLSTQLYPLTGTPDSGKRVRILIADAHPLLRYGLAALLSHYPEMDVCALAGSGCEAVEQFRQYRPDLVLIDMRMMLMEGLTATQAIRDVCPNACIIAMTHLPEKQRVTCTLTEGVVACWLKTSPLTDLVAIIRALDLAQTKGALGWVHTI